MSIQIKDPQRKLVLVLFQGEQFSRRETNVFQYNGQIMQVSHIYAKGSMCHEIRAHRFVIILRSYCTVFLD